MRQQKSQQFLGGLALGSGLAGGLVWLYCGAQLNEYALSQLKEAEYASAEAYAAMEADGNGQVQSNYLSYVHSAWENGGINDREYRRGLAIGLLRYCISLEERGREDVAAKACAMSENEFRRWNPGEVTYEKFREQAIADDPREYELRY